MPPVPPDPRPGPRSDAQPDPGSPPARITALRLALGAGGILVLAICAALTVSLAAAVVIPAIRGASRPTDATVSDGTAVVSQFCSDELSQQYAQAYTLFSPHLQGQVTQQQWESRSQQLDASQGTVSQCAPAQGGETSLTASAAGFDMEISRGAQGKTTDFTGTIHVVKSGSAWMIDAFDTSLGLG